MRTNKEVIDEIFEGLKYSMYSEHGNKFDTNCILALIYDDMINNTSRYQELLDDYKKERDDLLCEICTDFTSSMAYYMANGILNTLIIQIEIGEFHDDWRDANYYQFRVHHPEEGFTYLDEYNGRNKKEIELIVEDEPIIIDFVKIKPEFRSFSKYDKENFEKLIKNAGLEVESN